MPVNKPTYINPSTPLHHLAITFLCIILSFRHFHKHFLHETFSSFFLITLTWPDLSSDIEASDRGIGVVGSLKFATHFYKFTHMNMYMFRFRFCSCFGVHFQVANWNRVCAGRLEFGWAHSKWRRTLLGPMTRRRGSCVVQGWEPTSLTIWTPPSYCLPSFFQLLELPFLFRKLLFLFSQKILKFSNKSSKIRKANNLNSESKLLSAKSQKNKRHLSNTKKDA